LDTGFVEGSVAVEESVDVAASEADTPWVDGWDTSAESGVEAVVPDDPAVLFSAEAGGAPVGGDEGGASPEGAALLEGPGPSVGEGEGSGPDAAAREAFDAGGVVCAVAWCEGWFAGTVLAKIGPGFG
jgi:hypothetical protein